MALIDRTELFNRLSDKWDKAELYAILQGMPEADVVPARHASWNRDEYGFYHCSSCQSETSTRAPFCFWCGSEMVGETYETD